VLGPDGKPPQSAEIAFAAVDQALLQLSPNESWNLLDAMMGERPLSVITSTAAMQVVGKRHYGRKALPAGGGGGGDLTDLIRTDFKPVLLWRGRVKLDSEGRAEVDVPLADSLSAYKLVAIATPAATCSAPAAPPSAPSRTSPSIRACRRSSARATNMARPSP
jgi:uncharacterized protein YfaS (alpha-2-macroglobulin family)